MRHITLALTVAVGFAFPSAASATLIDRGGGLIYDDVLDITWLQDANMGGSMNWDDSVAWADTLVFGGFDDWRLPSMSVAGGLPTGLNNAPVVCTGAAGNEVACRDNELGYMYYFNGVTLAAPGPFQNLGSAPWSGTVLPSARGFAAWAFFFDVGSMLNFDLDAVNGSWAVRPGDVFDAAPEPSTLFLLGTGLIGLVGYTRRKNR